MAYSDHFLFNSASELLPIYQTDDDLSLSFFDAELDLFNDMVDLNPAVAPAVNPGVCEQVNSNPYHTTMSSSSLTQEDFNFTNPQCFPFLEPHWEEPLPFVKPDPQVTTKSAMAVPYDDEDSELDYALSFNPEPQQYPTHTQPYPYYAQPAQQYNIAAVYPQTMAYGQTPHTTVKAPKRHRVVEDEDDIDLSALDEPMDFGEEEDPTGGFKLPASKSPVMESMVVCALNCWGIELATNNRATSTTPAEVVFRVTDFNRYYKLSRTICSKQRPTDDLGSRIKTLRRWFVNFPKKKDRCENAFSLTVKPSIAKKVNEIIERNHKTLGLTKRRRRQ